jgi:hypothetical protein
MQSVTRVFTYKHADNWTVTGSETELLKSRNNNNNNMKSVTEPERVCVYLPVDGVEEADEGVDGGREAGAQFGGDATKEVGNNIGVQTGWICSSARPSAPPPARGRAPTQRRPPSLSPSLARSL